MNERERLMKVLKGETPDRVPWFADLGHWYRSQSGEPWDLFNISNRTQGMLALHKEVKAGWYIEVGSLHRETYIDGVKREKGINNGLAIEEYITSIGNLPNDTEMESDKLFLGCEKTHGGVLGGFKNSHLCRGKTSIRALL
jgi:hypothetical protein